MWIAIDIPQEAFEYISATSKLGWLSDAELAESIKNGIVLPEDLTNGGTISKQAVDDAIYDYSCSCDVNYEQIMERIDKIPPIIPQEEFLTKAKTHTEREENDYE